SRVMVLVFSDKANASKHIPREIERAIDHGVPVVPLRIENVQPRGALEYSLSSVHWLDALTPPIDTAVRKLAPTLRSIIKPPAPTEPDPARRVASDPSPAPLATGSPRQRLEPARTAEPRAQTASRLLPLGLAGLAIVVISSLATWYFVGRSQATPA